MSGSFFACSRMALSLAFHIASTALGIGMVLPVAIALRDRKPGAR